MNLLEKIKSFIDVAIQAELHAFALIVTGAGLAIAGHHDEAMLLLGGGLGILKGKS